MHESNFLYSLIRVVCKTVACTFIYHELRLVVVGSWTTRNDERERIVSGMTHKGDGKGARLLLEPRVPGAIVLMCLCVCV